MLNVLDVGLSGMMVEDWPLSGNVAGRSWRGYGGGTLGRGMNCFESNSWIMP